MVSAAPVTERARRVLLEAGVELREPDRVADEGWLLENLGDATILIAWFTPIGRRILEAAPALELIVSRSSGVDHIDVEYAEQRGVCVANQPEAIAFAVAEHALGLAIAAAKRLARSHAYALEGRWSREGRPPWIRGRLIRGSTVGVVGMGRIGALVAWYARSMGASRILYWSRRRKPELEQVLLAEPASLERLFRESDVVVVALPKTRETHRLIGCSLLSSMKSGAVLVNVGRGSVIDEEALARVIEE
ncbi:MAG: 2-hydroxyacid dehydrogenase, partial [Thermoproteota archaeon]